MNAAFLADEIWGGVCLNHLVIPGIMHDDTI